MAPNRLRPLLIAGTRPEAIKLAPVVRECLTRPDRLDPVVCLAGQHRELLAGVLDHFELPVHEHLDLLVPGQSLAELSARALTAFDQLLTRVRPDVVVVQGDTTTVMAASLAAFYRRVALVHVEAGLRTGCLDAPWPEELNRRIASLVACKHCAPTARAAAALQAEGIASDRIRITGNTVVDALQWTRECLRGEAGVWADRDRALGPGRMILVTAHRRENFGPGLEQICAAVAELAHRFGDCRFVYPVHLNPEVQGPVRRLLAGIPNVDLIAPAVYPEFVWLLDRACLVLTDSGGVQEEAPTFGKPVLVLRQCTERPEVVEAGGAFLVGTSTDAIVAQTTRLLTDSAAYAAAQLAHNPYGDGHAAQRIVRWMLDEV